MSTSVPIAKAANSEIAPNFLPRNGNHDGASVPEDHAWFAGGSNLLKDRVCVLVGGGSIAPGWGIGKSTAAAYAREGARVAVADINPDSALETAQVIRSAGGHAIPFEVDVTNDDSIVRLMQDVQAEFGVIDVLHNNVGLAKSGDPALITPEDWRRIQDANVTSLHVATQAVLPSMIERKRGVIITTSSIAATRHLGYSSLAYATTKAAALHFTRTLAIEYAAHGIRANTILAGLIDTPRIKIYLKNRYQGSVDEMREQRHRVVPMGHMGSAWDIAEAAVFLASDRARYITGTELIVDGGLSMTVPH